MCEVAVIWCGRPQPGTGGGVFPFLGLRSLVAQQSSPKASLGTEVVHPPANIHVTLPRLAPRHRQERHKCRTDALFIPLKLSLVPQLMERARHPVCKSMRASALRVFPA